VDLKMDIRVIGFVGLGRMGTPMARRLLESGLEVVVYDTQSKAVAELVRLGARAGESAQQIGDEADLVFSSLPTPAIVKAVLIGPQGIADGKRVKILADLSTIGPRTAVEIYDALKARGLIWVEVPVSGGIKGAEAGTLAVMAACPKPLFDELQPILRCLGKLFFTGEKAGLAQTAKLANNLLSAAAMVISSEAMVMGVKAGLDPAVLLDIINAGSGRNSATVDKIPRAVLNRRFDYGFSTELSYKDTRLCIDEAEAMGVPMPVGGLIRQMLAATNAKYGPDSDFTSVARIYEEWAKVEIGG
jgi:3-hydroxyisobutyrate dehydrogenase-like beta-hydroxyacid dehydrogenase